MTMKGWEEGKFTLFPPLHGHTCPPSNPQWGKRWEEGGRGGKRVKGRGERAEGEEVGGGKRREEGKREDPYRPSL